MNNLLLCVLSILILNTSSHAPVDPPTRNVKILDLTGNGYERGYQHGKQLHSDIAEIIVLWKSNTSKALNKNAEEVLDQFFEYANFESAIKKYTPELLEEVKGIAEGSGQKYRDIMVLKSVG